MSIFTFDKLLWQMAMTTIKNKQEPNPHGIMLRLGGFHNPVSYLKAVSSSGLWSLLAFDLWDSFTSRDYWEPGSWSWDYLYRSRWQCHGWGGDMGTSPVNECCSANENWVDNAVVHSECPLCMCWNQWSTSEVHISWFQDKWPTQRQQLDRHDTTKIIKFLDNENPFGVNSATQHFLGDGIVVHQSGNADM